MSGWKTLAQLTRPALVTAALVLALTIFGALVSAATQVTK